MNQGLPSIGIMILNQNGADWLPPLYESLRKQTYLGLNVYLVDNASSDDSVVLTIERFPEIKVLRFSKNVGYCIAYNRAMPHAFADGCEWVVWANNDVLLEPDCLLEMGKVATQSSEIGIVGPTFYAWDSDEPNYYMKGKHPRAIEPMKSSSSNAFEVDWVEGSFLMVSEKCVADVGALDPYLFFYWEETDFCRRARRKGWHVVLAPRAIARHYAGGWSSGNQGNENTASFLKSRNQYIYVLTNPESSFRSNLLKGIYLFLVLCKAALKKSLPALLYEFRAFSRVILELSNIKRKWHRDHGGLPTALTAPEYDNVSLEVFGGLTASEAVKH